MVNVYPDPFNTKITIVSGGAKQIVRVFNALGEMVLSAELSASDTELNLTQQAKGIYFIRIGNVVKKIVKE